MLSRVLRADFKYVYQLALLKSELEEIFARAPPIQNTDAGAASTPADDEKRKPIEGDCSVCYSEFEPAKEKIVWCRAACGQNFHQKCFDTWAATKRTSGRSQVTCPMCRSVWQGDDGGGLGSHNINRNGPRNRDGYVNIAGQLGISPIRGMFSLFRLPRDMD